MYDPVETDPVHVIYIPFHRRIFFVEKRMDCVVFSLLGGENGREKLEAILVMSFRSTLFAYLIRTKTNKSNIK